MRGKVFTIAPGAPFLSTFVETFLGGEIVGAISRNSTPLALARATIYVPTQRAARALAVEFGRAFQGRATFLPRILPLGGLEEQENVALFGDIEADFDAAYLPPIEELERKLLLAQLVMQWSKAVGHAIISIDPTGARVLDETEPFLVASTPAGAFALAKHLGELIDDIIIEGVDADGIDKVADEAFDRFWAITTQFLRIALREWPSILAERGRIDAATRQKILIESQINALTLRKDGAPIVAIGSTGAHPTTARLLAAIAALDNGAVVLPGLDRAMDEDAWARIGENEREPVFTHPQTLLKRLLGVMKIDRLEAREIGQMSEALAARRMLIAEAMAPAEATSGWRAFREQYCSRFPEALADVTSITAADERVEALALAVAMREALDTPDRTAALVTPDRNIARRVNAELCRFNIAVDDSGGAPLASSPAGALARLIASIGAEGLCATNAVAMLAHPFAAFGRSRTEIAALAPLLEIGVLRTSVATIGLSESIQAARKLARAKHAYPAARRVSDEQWIAIEELAGLIEAAVECLVVLRGENPLAAYAKAHSKAFEAITRGSVEPVDDGASALIELFDRLAAADSPLCFEAADYASLFDQIAFETTLRGPRRAHPRLKILGPLEARLVEADLMLVAGLDEGLWPPQADTGVFLNRKMRAALGLPSPERRIGQSAHDLVMSLGAKSVVLSRAIKRDGAPTVPSRFFSRIEALAGDAFAASVGRGERLIAAAAALDRARVNIAISRPAPRPPLELRPSKLSVTRVERLRRDPYAIYAEYVLGLTPLAPLGAPIGAREMGTAIHEALARFVARHPRGPLPAGARGELQALARDALAEFFRDPGFAIFTWPGVAAGFDHVLKFEESRRARSHDIFVETYGEWPVSLTDGSQFTLTAIADRIEVDAQGNASVFDYKTGATPTNKQVRAGWSPQLTLEAAMIEAGGFAKVGAHPIADAAYLGVKKGGSTQWLEWSDASFCDVVNDHRAKMTIMLSGFRDVSTPYPSRPFVAFVTGASEYDHLARVKEWSRGGADNE